MQQRIKVNDVELNVRVDGPADAPWLVLSNSLGAALDMWNVQVPVLGRHYRLLRYDTRGHGESAVPDGPWSIDQLGGDVVGLLDAFDIERAHFCGLSMGGATGMWLAAHAPARVDRLVLCNTTPWLGPPEPMNARIETVRRQGVGPLVEATLERWFTPEFHVRDPAAVDAIRRTLLATSGDGYVRCCEALRDMDQRADLAHILAPTLVIAGTYDPAPTPAAARAWAAVIPRMQFVELPAAHISNIGAVDEFNRVVAGFLAADPV